MSIWDELPDRISSVKPTLGRNTKYNQCHPHLFSPAYSSNEHGVSLTTFFNRVDKYEPTIIAVRTTDKEVGSVLLTLLGLVDSSRLLLSCPLLYIVILSRCLERTAQPPGSRGTRRMTKVSGILYISLLGGRDRSI